MFIASNKERDGYVSFDITAPLTWWNELLNIFGLVTIPVCGIRYYCKTGINADNFYWHDDFTRACLDEVIKELNIILYRYRQATTRSEMDRQEQAFWDLLPNCFLDRRRMTLDPPELNALYGLMIGTINPDKFNNDPDWREFKAEIEQYMK